MKMFRYFFAIFLTLLLGPGVGHLAIRQYKKAIIIILIDFIMTFYFVSTLDSTFINSASYNINFFLELQKTLFANTYYVLGFALILAYALADIVWHAYLEFKNKAK